MLHCPPLSEAAAQLLQGSVHLITRILSESEFEPVSLGWILRIRAFPHEVWALVPPQVFFRSTPFGFRNRCDLVFPVSFKTCSLP